MDYADVERAVSRTGRYFFDDGLWEIAVGLWLAFTVAVPAFIGGQAAEWAGLPMLLGATAIRPLVLAAKSRWVFPRTGRVTYVPPGSRSGGWWGAVAAVGVAAATASLLLLSRAQPLGDAAGHAAMGVLWAAVFLYAAWRWGQRRWNFVAIAMPAFAALVAAAGLDWKAAIALHALGVSLILVASGTLAFAGYLRHAPKPGAAADGR